ncbi:MAG TPA: hypothetical protein PLI09_00770 [Candidatus Hydrogenedentes bacterium]|nr:hypothetical protein [Candidatus Hydrogenedentota bacterium]
MHAKSRLMAVGVVLVLGAFLLSFVSLDALAAPKAPKPPKPTPPSHTARQDRPIQLGVSGGIALDLANGYCCGGTLGSLVKDASGVQYILSNTHVFAGDIDDTDGIVSTPGDPVDQPGLIDVGCSNIPADYVANLSNWAVIVPDGISVVDAAIAQVIPGMVDPQGKILEIGTISATPLAAALNQAVKKSGRTSGLTTGKVVGLNATISVLYSTECAGTDYVSTLNGQILISPGKFLKAGDSGSLMVENVATNPRAIGLLYAGSSKVAIANPIQDVLNYFGVSMVGVATAASNAAAASDTVKASKAKENNKGKLMAVPGAVGHAVGLATNGKAVVKVLVEKITPEARAAAPLAVDNVPVELMEVGKVVAF